MSVDIDKLEALAREATPGPWTANEVYESVEAKHGDLKVCDVNYGVVDARYIAAASPDAIIALTTELRALRTQVAELERAHERFCPRHPAVERILTGCFRCGAPQCCPACCEEASEGLEEHRREVALVAERDALRTQVADLTAQSERNAQRCLDAFDDIALLLVERNNERARAEKAEAELEARALAAEARAEEAERLLAIRERDFGATLADLRERAEKAEARVADLEARSCHICGGVPPSNICSACVPACQMADGRCAMQSQRDAALARAERAERERDEARAERDAAQARCEEHARNFRALDAIHQVVKAQRDARLAITREDALRVVGGRKHTNGNGLGFDGDKAAWEAFDRVEAALKAHAKGGE